MIQKMKKGYSEELRDWQQQTQINDVIKFIKKAMITLLDYNSPQKRFPIEM